MNLCGIRTSPYNGLSHFGHDEQVVVSKAHRANAGQQVKGPWAPLAPLPQVNMKLSTLWKGTALGEAVD